VIEIEMPSRSRTALDVAGETQTAVPASRAANRWNLIERLPRIHYYHCVYRAAKRELRSKTDLQDLLRGILLFLI